jgi:hypothetical protein
MAYRYRGEAGQLVMREQFVVRNREMRNHSTMFSRIYGVQWEKDKEAIVLEPLGSNIDDWKEKAAKRTHTTHRTLFLIRFDSMYRCFEGNSKSCLSLYFFSSVVLSNLGGVWSGFDNIMGVPFFCECARPGQMGWLARLPAVFINNCNRKSENFLLSVCLFIYLSLVDADGVCGI